MLIDKWISVAWDRPLDLVRYQEFPVTICYHSIYRKSALFEIYSQNSEKEVKVQVMNKLTPCKHKARKNARNEAMYEIT